MLVDSHCHLDFPDFKDELGDVIRRAELAGVGHMVTICTHICKFDQIKAIAESYDNIFCSVGTHPHNADQELDFTAEDIAKLADHPKCVAIGEAGLDYFYDNAPRQAQAQGLRTHIKAARMTQLPLVIHSRDADEDMISILSDEMEQGTYPALLHCFSSGRELAMRAVDMGLYVSLSGILTFKRSQDIRDIVADVPMDRLLVETDAPYLAPMPYRGKRNEPAYVAHTAEMLAEVKGVSIDEIANITTDNFFRLFSKAKR
ncbi:TatD family hydrolase [Cohaesibacter celericrescens]|uniref:LuxR family transcriptional regulator n=1 Tax=Cohaesibacter celericrescens TaxID=2067669 RepID=A0A2N5XSY9_9HYPH|nr:TatD family hydrolase [Cohaesibacter celericrescens]PLW77609.1 LuxR family transcriptional regulator [Cohaesibacter celericrescens]